MAEFTEIHNKVYFQASCGDYANKRFPIEECATPYGNIMGLVMQLEPICTKWPSCTTDGSQLTCKVDNDTYAIITFDHTVKYLMRQSDESFDYATTTDIEVFRKFTEFIHSKLDDIRNKSDLSFIKKMRKLQPKDLTRKKK